MVEPAFENVGQRIRDERQRIGLTLAELAKAAGVSTSYISLVENGKSLPSLKILDKICSRLSIHLSALFSNPPTETQAGFKKFDKRDHIVAQVSKHRQLTFLLPQHSVPMEPVRLSLEPGSDYARPTNHTGVEFGYVIQGTVKVCISGLDAGECDTGDSFLYNAMLPHVLVNPGQSLAEMILVSLPHHEWGG